MVININLQLGFGDFGVLKKIEILSFGFSVIFKMLICLVNIVHLHFGTDLTAALNRLRL